MYFSKYFKNILGMTTGTVFVQSIPILASLIIARLYSPSDFGIFSFWLAIVTILSTIMTCKYETALTIVKDGIDRVYALLGIFSIIILLGFFSFIILLFLIKLNYLHDFFALSIIIPSSVTLSMNITLQNKLAADGTYKKLIIIRLIQVFLVSFLQVLFGYLSSNAENLCYGVFIGNLISVIIYFIFSYNSMNITICSYNTFLRIKRFLIKYKNFALFGLPASTCNIVAAQLPIIIITLRFGDDMAGFYALTMRVLGAPIGLLGKSILDVFKRNAAQSYLLNGQCKKEYLQTLNLLLIGSIFLVLGTLFLAKPIFNLMYGKSWEYCGELAIILLPLFAMRFIASPLSYIVFIVEKQKVDLYWQIILLLVTLLSLYSFSDFNETINVYSYCYATLYIIYLFMSYSFSKGRLP